MLCRSCTANHGSCEFMCAIASVKSRRQHLTALLPMLWVLLSVHTLSHESDLWGGEFDVNDPSWDWTLITIYSQHFHWFRLSVLGTVLFFNVQCHNTDKGTCYQPWYPKFSPWKLHGKREPIPTSCPLTCRGEPWHMPFLHKINNDK